MNWQWTSIDSISQLNKEEFSQLVSLEAPFETASTPFLSYSFLSNLEQSNCVGKGSGWLTQHIVIRYKGTPKSDNTLKDNDASGSTVIRNASNPDTISDEIVAFIPAYLKTHSYGEYVFDHSWANAYQQNGLAYYPKLIMAIPFTPVTGTRVLKKIGIEADALLDYIGQIKTELLQRLSVSSLHMLFSPAACSEKLSESGFHQRHSVQFNWHNKGYTDYADFTSLLTARRRRSIKKERASIIKQGVKVKRIVGKQIDSVDMHFFYSCYQQTYLKRSGHGGYLTREFFDGLLSDMPDNLMLVIAGKHAEHDPENYSDNNAENHTLTQAEKQGHPIAAALFLHDENGLYGRYWGALEDISGLHFEACYYQGIEFCIDNNIALFNPGTQGEHKILRGFEPTICYSNHVMAEPAFDDAIKDFLQREKPHIIEYFTQSQSLLPFKQDPNET